MKKSILLTLIMILSTNVLFLNEGVPTSTKEPVQIQNREEINLAKIQPTGICFAEEDELP